MSTPNPPDPNDKLEAELVRFLISAFSVAEMKRQIRFYTPADGVDPEARAEVIRKIDESERSLNAITWALIERLMNDGVDLPALRAALIAERPGRTHDIHTKLATFEPAQAYDLFVSLFSLAELERFMRYALGNGRLYDEVLSAQPFVQAVRGMQKGKLIRAGFWAGLIQQRPGRTAEIVALQLRWEGGVSPPMPVVTDTAEPEPYH